MQCYAETYEKNRRKASENSPNNPLNQGHLVNFN